MNVDRNSYNCHFLVSVQDKNKSHGQKFRKKVSRKCSFYNLRFAAELKVWPKFFDKFIEKYLNVDFT